MLLFMRKVLIFDPSSRLHSTTFEIGLQSSLWIRIRRTWMTTDEVFRIKSKNLIFETFRFSKNVMMFVMWLRIKAWFFSRIFLQHLFLPIERYKVVYFCWILRGLLQAFSTNRSRRNEISEETHVFARVFIFARTFMRADHDLCGSTWNSRDLFLKIDDQAETSSRIASRSKQIYYLWQPYSRRKPSVKNTSFDATRSSWLEIFKFWYWMTTVWCLGCNDLKDLSIY